MAKRRLLGGMILCAGLLAPAWATPPTAAVIGTPPQPVWSQLTSQQRTVLAPLSRDWDSMENFRRKKWLLIAERYSAMKPEEQQRMQDRMREWARMTPEQRAKVRDSYKEFTQLPTEKKQVVKQKWETYSGLSEEEKARIKQEKAAARAATLAPPAPANPEGQPAQAPASPPPAQN